MTNDGPFGWDESRSGYKFYFNGRLEGELIIEKSNPHPFKAYVFVVRHPKCFDTEEEARDWMKNVFGSRGLFDSQWEWRRHYGQPQDGVGHDCE